MNIYDEKSFKMINNNDYDKSIKIMKDDYEKSVNHLSMNYEVI